MGVTWVLPDLGCSLIVKVALSVLDRWPNPNQVVSVLTAQPLPLPPRMYSFPIGSHHRGCLGRTDHPLFPVTDAVICFAQTLRKLIRADLEISNPKDNFSGSNERWKMRALKEVFR